MDRYRPKKGRIFGGIFLLILAGFVLWFMAVGYLLYTPLAKLYSVRGIGGYYVEGKITELIGFSAENGGAVTQLRTEYYIGLQRVESILPAEYFILRDLKWATLYMCLFLKRILMICAWRTKRLLLYLLHYL